MVVSFSTIAKYPKFVKEIIKSTEEEGKYEIKLFDVIKKDYITVIIDDFVPCKCKNWWDLTAEPIFSSPFQNIVWTLLLEKAFAK